VRTTLHVPLTHPLTPQVSGYPVRMLNTQYRMHPDISVFPSRQFYGGGLLNGEVRGWCEGDWAGTLWCVCSSRLFDWCNSCGCQRGVQVLLPGSQCGDGAEARPAQAQATYAATCSDCGCLTGGAVVVECHPRYSVSLARAAVLWASCVL
jgi:hypothetical protein